MRMKILRYAAGRDDKIVSAYEDVTFENERMGWSVDMLHDSDNRVWDILAVVEQIGEVAFVACFRLCDKALQPGFLRAVTDEMQHSWKRMQECIGRGIWISRPYVAGL